MAELEKALRGRLAAGGKNFVPYVTGGFPGVTAQLLRQLQDAGADAIEVGIPHSDPVMDGGVIQEASRVSLERGTHPKDVLSMISEASLAIPVAVMTYYNIVFHRGVSSFLDEAAGAGVSGAIIPDLPVDEATEFDQECAVKGIDAVLLCAPGTSDQRVKAIATNSHGFVYCVATYGVTGARDALTSDAEGVVKALRPHTDVPLLVGVGIGTPDQAAAACGFADGVIVGSALMKKLLDDDAAGAIDLAEAFRRAIPSGS